MAPPILLTKVRGRLLDPRGTSWLWARLDQQVPGLEWGLRASEGGELVLSAGGTLRKGRKLVPYVSFPLYSELSHVASTQNCPRKNQGVPQELEASPKTSWWYPGSLPSSPISVSLPPLTPMLNVFGMSSVMPAPPSSLLRHN